LTDPKPEAAKTAVETISLAALCKELKVDPYDARQKLREAVKDSKTYPTLAKSHKPRSAWEWAKTSPALKEVRMVLTAK
jgi:hypothetical protein